MKDFKQLPPAAADYFTYAISFALVFDLAFLPGIQDGSETMGMFLLVSVFMAIVLVVFSFLFYYFTKGKLIQHFLAYCALIYLLSELIAGLMLGRPCLFGLFLKPVVYNGEPYPDIYIFQKHAALGLSYSFVIAAVICIVRKALVSFMGNKSSNTN